MPLAARVTLCLTALLVISPAQTATRTRAVASNQPAAVWTGGRDAIHPSRRPHRRDRLTLIRGGRAAIPTPGEAAGWLISPSRGGRVWPLPETEDGAASGKPLLGQWPTAWPARKQRSLKHHGHGHRGHKHHGHKHHGHKHRRHKHRGHKHHGHKHHGHKHHGHKHHGHKHNGYRHGHHKGKRSLHHLWRKLDKGINSLLHHHHRSKEPRHGQSDTTVTHWRLPEIATARPSQTWPHWSVPETATARPSQTWPHWSVPETATAHPSQTWPHWSVPETATARPTQTWPHWPLPETTTAAVTSTTTTTTSSSSTAASQPPTPAPDSWLGAGVLVATSPPLNADVWPTCHPGFSYHAESGVCVERCPRGAAYRQQVCFCNAPGYFVDFIQWRCVPGPRAVE